MDVHHCQTFHIYSRQCVDYLEVINNTTESLNKSIEGKKRKQTHNHFSFGNVLTHV
jgi:hypothetical protein